MIQYIILKGGDLLLMDTPRLEEVFHITGRFIRMIIIVRTNHEITLHLELYNYAPVSSDGQLNG